MIDYRKELEMAILRGLLGDVINPLADDWNEVKKVIHNIVKNDFKFKSNEYFFRAYKKLFTEHFNESEAPNFEAVMYFIQQTAPKLLEYYESDFLEILAVQPITIEAIPLYLELIRREELLNIADHL